MSSHGSKAYSGDSGSPAKFCRSGRESCYVVGVLSFTAVCSHSGHHIEAYEATSTHCEFVKKHAESGFRCFTKLIIFLTGFARLQYALRELKKDDEKTATPETTTMKLKPFEPSEASLSEEMFQKAMPDSEDFFTSMNLEERKRTQLAASIDSGIFCDE
ncbi:hypothetical protein QR680_014471 [Steinernema hermaphroditum]|uniref:Peptidase S1 domain-containing protein n=1 Tax=Steinernema hermaphroditum TaxID=289476 RepID=A0AA39M443_9BILA|nr:hypothetical protein QR680_014471 [Steinernema hermaphroditum]